MYHCDTMWFTGTHVTNII